MYNDLFSTRAEPSLKHAVTTSVDKAPPMKYTGLGLRVWVRARVRVRLTWRRVNLTLTLALTLNELTLNPNRNP